MSDDKYRLGHLHGSTGAKPVHRDLNYERGYEDAVVRRAYTESKNKPSSRARNQLKKTQESLAHLGAGKPYGEK